MTDKCPVCDKDITDALYAEEIHDFEQDHEIECPECGSKILASMEWSFVVKAKQGTFVCPKCGEDWFDEKFVFDCHVTYCKGKQDSPVTAEVATNNRKETEESK